MSILLSPLIGLIILLIAGKNIKAIEQAQIDSGEFKRCPSCAELVREDAVKCKHCGSDAVAGVKAAKSSVWN